MKSACFFVFSAALASAVSWQECQVWKKGVGEHVNPDSSCLGNGGKGCISTSPGSFNGCRFCEFGGFLDVPCVTRNPDQKGDNILKGNTRDLDNCMSKVGDGEKATFSPQCVFDNGIFGCVEDLGTFTGCRYCEFGEYSSIPCASVGLAQLSPLEQSELSQYRLLGDTRTSFIPVNNDFLQKNGMNWASGSSSSSSSSSLTPQWSSSASMPARMPFNDWRRSSQYSSMSSLPRSYSSSSYSSLPRSYLPSNRRFLLQGRSYMSSPRRAVTSFRQAPQWRRQASRSIWAPQFRRQAVVDNFGSMGVLQAASGGGSNFAARNVQNEVQHVVMNDGPMIENTKDSSQVQTKTIVTHHPVFYKTYLDHYTQHDTKLDDVYHHIGEEEMRYFDVEGKTLSGSAQNIDHGKVGHASYGSIVGAYEGN